MGKRLEWKTPGLPPTHQLFSLLNVPFIFRVRMEPHPIVPGPPLMGGHMLLHCMIYNTIAEMKWYQR